MLRGADRQTSPRRELGCGTRAPALVFPNIEGPQDSPSACKSGYSKHGGVGGEWADSWHLEYPLLHKDVSCNNVPDNRFGLYPLKNTPPNAPCLYPPGQERDRGEGHPACRPVTQAVMGAEVTLGPFVSEKVENEALKITSAKYKTQNTWCGGQRAGLHRAQRSSSKGR